MNQIIKKIVSLFILISFLATVALCCCVAKSSFAAKKVSCSHCATKASKAAPKECCFSKASPMEMAKVFTSFPMLPLLILTAWAIFYIKPRTLAFKNIYRNGPPGAVYVVPLYIQSRSLRI